MHNTPDSSPRRVTTTCPASRSAQSDESIVLWRLRGSKHELVCAIIITSFGYGLHLALAGEPILFELQRSVDLLTDKATRLECWLLEQGWSRIQSD